LDARLNDYEFYACLDYNVYLALNGDSLDRYFLRFNEMVESCRIIYSLLLFLFSSSFLFSLFSLFSSNYFSLKELTAITLSRVAPQVKSVRLSAHVAFATSLAKAPYIFCEQVRFSREATAIASSFSSTMEMLIYEFLITFPFLLSFLFVLKLSIESSKGIYSIFITAFPY
jgi:hypothetical protein